MANPAHKRMTLAEFLAWDDGTDRRYELIDGAPVAMAPTAGRHGRLLARLAAWFEARLPDPCQCILEAGIALPHRDDAFYVADLAVACRHVDLDRQYQAEPRLIIEVLSPTTERHDRLVKLPDYRTIPSVQDIALVHTDERRVELWSRLDGRWVEDEVRDGQDLVIASLDLRMDLGTLYAGIVEPASD